MIISEFEKSLMLLILKKDLAVEEAKLNALKSVPALLAANDNFSLLVLMTNTTISQLKFMIENLENPTESVKQ